MDYIASVTWKNKTFILPKSPGVSPEADIVKAWVIASQNPTTEHEYIQAHTWAEYYHNVKYLGMTYSPKIMTIIERFNTIPPITVS